MNIQDIADKCIKKFQDKMGDNPKVSPKTIAQYCRMLTIYCDAEGKVTESFIKSMEKYAAEITSVEGMEEIFNECNKCPEDI